jgi:hypothetical protein
VSVCFPDEERHLLGSELRAQQIRAWRVYAAAGHHLDDVDAAVGAFLDRPGRVVEVLYLAP